MSRDFFLSNFFNSSVRSRLGFLLLVLLFLAVGINLNTALAQQQSTDKQPADKQPADKSTPRRVTKFDASRFISRVIDGERVSIGIGNVFVDRDSLTAASDSAQYFEERQVYWFFSNVEFVRDNAVLNCERATWDRNNRRSEFFENVRMVDGDLIATGKYGKSQENGRFVQLMDNALLVTPEYSVRADTITRDRLTGEGEAFGHVKILEPGAKNLVEGDHAIFLAEGDVAEVDKNPVLISRDQEGGPLRSVAGLMRFYRQEDKVVMIDSVRINQGQTRAEADTAIAYGRNRMILTGNPRVAMDGASNMIGDYIEFLYKDGEIDRLIVTGNARMEDTTPDSLATLFKGLPNMDVLEGDSISIQFENDKISQATVVGTARSQYTPLDLNDEVATNDVRGDTIVIDFSNQRVRHVNVVGNMTGTYQFAKVALMRDMLGNSRKLSDLLARRAEIEASTDSTLLDETSMAFTDSLKKHLVAEIDSLVTEMGFVLPDFLPGTDQLAATISDSMLTAALDSLASAGFDTSQTTMDFLSNAQDVKYSGGSVDFEMAKKSIDIQEDGSLTFGTMKLTAQRIQLNTVKRELYAEGDPLIEDSDLIAGDKMGYNFKDRTGAVQDGVTSFDEYYYAGDEIVRFPDSTLKICSGKMTSCDLADPHYHFWSDKMKIRMGDKIVAKPIVLRIGEVPIFALPFFFKSLKSGRQSGILFPSMEFGWSSREGRYIRDFGYYWATNDYTDLMFQGSYNERQDLRFRIRNRYNKRYSFSGNIDYTKTYYLGDNSKRQWQFRWNHRQDTLFDDYKFNAEVALASETLTANNLTSSANRDIVNTDQKTKVTVSRNWSGANANLSISGNQFLNREDDDIATNNQTYTATLPSLRLSFKQITLGSPLRGAERGNIFGDMLRATTFSQNYGLEAKREGRETTRTADYTGKGSWSLRTSIPDLSIFKFSFSSNASQNWSRSTTTGETWEPDIAATDTTAAVGHWEDANNRDEDTRSSLSFTANAGTTLYGLFPMQVGRLRAIRHTFNFNTGWTLSPHLGEKQARSTSYSFSMTNRLDVKYLSADSDSTMAEKKLDGLFDWRLGTSYNPQREPDKRWGNISSGLTIKPSKSRYLQLKVNNSIDPYSMALRSTSFGYNFSFNGRADLGNVVVPEELVRNASIERLGIDHSAGADSTAVDQYDDEYQDEYQGGYRDGDDGAGQYDNRDSFSDRFADNSGGSGSGDKDPTEGGRFIPFSLNASLSYRYTNGVGGKESTRRTTGSVNLQASLTKNWKFKYSTSYDLVEGTATRQQYSLERDLHCWRLEFNRTINSLDSTFGFRLYLISIPALKFTRGREDGMGSLGGSLAGGF